MRRTSKIGALLVALLLLTPAAFATIRKSPGAYTFGPTAVWPRSNSVTDLFHPLSDPLPSAGFNQVRWMQELSQSPLVTPNAKIKAALRYGVDGVNWDPPVAIAPTYQSTDGISQGTGYVDVTAGQKQWVQFGVLVAQGSASTTVEVVNATILIDPKQTP